MSYLNLGTNWVSNAKTSIDVPAACWEVSQALEIALRAAARFCETLRLPCRQKQKAWKKNTDIYGILLPGFSQ